MRTIKFRAWDKTTKSLIDDYAHVGSYGELYPKQFHSSTYSDKGCPDLILMQFTGLLDKNGKEIYEGDIIRIISEDIIYKPFEVKLYEFLHGTKLCPCEYVGGYAGDFEVIGNIYENGDLLK